MAPIDPIIQDLQTRRFREMSAHRKLELADAQRARDTLHGHRRCRRGRWRERFLPLSSMSPPVEAIEQEALRPAHGHFNLLHLGSGLRADIYLAGDDVLDAWGLERRHAETIAGEKVWIAPAEYVIVRKLEYSPVGVGSRAPYKYL